MDSDNLLTPTRSDTSRSLPGVARRPHGFTSLQLLRQNKAKKLRQMQLNAAVLAMSTQTDSSRAVIWIQTLRNKVRGKRPRRLCNCSWHDYLLGTFLRTIGYCALIGGALFVNLDVLLSICEKAKRLSNYS